MNNPIFTIKKKFPPATPVISVLLFCFDGDVKVRPQIGDKIKSMTENSNNEGGKGTKAIKVLINGSAFEFQM